MDEDLYRDVDVLSSEDEADVFTIFKNEVSFKDSDGNPIEIGSRGERLSKIKKVATMLSHQMSLKKSG